MLPAADPGGAENLLQFLVKALVALPPVDGRVHRREEQRQAGGQEMLERLLPRAVEVRARPPFGHGGHDTGRPTPTQEKELEKTKSAAGFNDFAGAP
jgi:hypothetical protein